MSESRRASTRFKSLAMASRFTAVGPPSARRATILATLEAWRQGCVLTVVGEAQQLARFWTQTLVPLQRNERPYRKDCRCSAPAAHTEGGQLETLRTLSPGVSDSARRFQAEEEVPVQQGHRHTFAFRHDSPGMGDDHWLRNVAAGVGTDPFLAGSGRLLERTRQATEQRRASAPRPGRFLGEMYERFTHPTVHLFPTVLAGQQPPAIAIGRQPDPVVRGSATATENEWEQRLVRIARLRGLLRDLQMAIRFRFERCPDRIATRQKLMQPEREDGKAAGVASVQAGTSKQPAAKRFGATFRIRLRQRRKLRRRARYAADRIPLQAPRRLPEQPAGVRFLADSESRFDPGGESRRNVPYSTGGSSSETTAARMAARTEGSANSISGVARSRLSVTTWSGAIGTPKRDCDTAATSRRCCSLPPPLAIVAEVPIQTTRLPTACRQRRISIAMSAP